MKNWILTLALLSVPAIAQPPQSPEAAAARAQAQAKALAAAQEPAIEDFKPSTLEIDDRLKKEDEGVVVFDFQTQGVIDGFDFKVGAGRCVTFHLLVDGKPAPKEVEIGKKELPANSATFRLCR
jgi:hypothetical protein